MVWAIALSLLVLSSNALVASRIGLPKPIYHDEFSYLLAADTFAQGRLSNPPHPMAEHFETFHVLQYPRYASAYFPGQGLVLALGQRFFSHPAYGLWISAAWMTLCSAWMLVAWLPRRWAFLGALFVALRFGVISYWTQSYWGGALAASGGALLFGALRRLADSVRCRDVLAMGAGTAILSITRPLEGLWVTCSALAWIFWKFYRRRAPRREWQKFMGIFALCSLGIFLWAGFYNRVVTGNPWTPPQAVHNLRYGSIPLFLWQPLREPVNLSEPVLKQYEADFAKALELRRRSLVVWRRSVVDALRRMQDFFLNPVLFWLCLGVLPWMLRNVWNRFAVVVLGGLMFFLAACLSWMPQPHYLAPVTVFFALMVAGAMQKLFRWGIRRPLFQVILTGVLLFAVLRPFFNYILFASQYASASNAPRAARSSAENWISSREGKHLLLVKYNKGHNLDAELVFNQADIDRSPVVWARSKDDQKNLEIIRYYPGRQAWLLDVAGDDSKLAFYPMHERTGRGPLDGREGL